MKLRKDVYEVLNALRTTGHEIIKEGRELGSRLILGKSLFNKSNNSASEKDYKLNCSYQGKIMYHSHLCRNNTNQFLDGLGKIHKILENRGISLDRFGVSLDYSMGLPPGMRCGNIHGDGLMLNCQGDWDVLASSYPAQPHLGDHMIGSPASAENTVMALKAGITTIGNISQYFGWDYAECPDIHQRTLETVKAIAIMSSHIENGTLIHSNLDDGYGARLGDLGLVLGWALLERYVVEELIGAKIAHSFGDMFFSPEKRLIFLAALKKACNNELVGSMLFGCKLRRSTDIELNASNMAGYILADMVGQKMFKTGHAVTPLAQEGLSMHNTPEDIAKSIVLAYELEKYVGGYAEILDTEAIENLAEKLVNRGQGFFKNIITGLKDYIDVRDAYALMLALKMIGIADLVREFEPSEGPGIRCDSTMYKH